MNSEKSPEQLIGKRKISGTESPPPPPNKRRRFISPYSAKPRFNFIFEKALRSAEQQLGFPEDAEAIWRRKMKILQSMR